MHNNNMWFLFIPDNASMYIKNKFNQFIVGLNQKSYKKY